MVAPVGQAGERFWNCWVHSGAVAREEQRIRDRAREVLAFCGLERVAGDLRRRRGRLLAKRQRAFGAGGTAGNPAGAA
jgi:hypothetical protein